MKVDSTLCNALIDTGATRTCMSEAYCRKLQLNKIHLLSSVHVRSATGSNLSPLGIVDCTFELGKTAFTSDFIVCKNLNKTSYFGMRFFYEKSSNSQIFERQKMHFGLPSRRINSFS